MLGAPVQWDPQCKSNVQITFTIKPQEKMDEIMKWATGLSFRNRYSGGMKELIAYKSDHVIQGWYMVTGGGAVVLTTDVSLVGFNVLPVWPQSSKIHGNRGYRDTFGRWQRQRQWYRHRHLDRRHNESRRLNHRDHRRLLGDVGLVGGAIAGSLRSIAEHSGLDVIELRGA